MSSLEMVMSWMMVMVLHVKFMKVRNFTGMALYEIIARRQFWSGGIQVQKRIHWNEKYIVDVQVFHYSDTIDCTYQYHIRYKLSEIS